MQLLAKGHHLKVIIFYWWIDEGKEDKKTAPLVRGAAGEIRYWLLVISYW
jgi:hypothetical protein